MSGGSGPARYIQFDEDIERVPVDRARTDGEQFGDLAISVAGRKQTQDFQFPVSKLALEAMHRCSPFLPDEFQRANTLIVVAGKGTTHRGKHG